MKQLQDQLRLEIFTALQKRFPILPEEITFSIPGDRQFGDLSTTLPFVLAKKLKSKPFLIGQDMLLILQGKCSFVESAEIAGGGFINFRLHKDALFNRLLAQQPPTPSSRSGKVVVEHTSINPNHSAHIGHLRNSCLGDTLARGYHFLGHPVEVQNYIDDTGIQMADVVWGLLYLEKKTLNEIKGIPDLAQYLWRLYPEVSHVLKKDEALSSQRNEVHKKIEEKIDPEYEVCRHVAHEVLRDQIRVMESLGIRYDLLAWENDIITLGLFVEASRLLKENGIMYESADPAKKKCWVIFYEREKLEKIVIRSNGTITYIGKDIAYNLWKFGLLSGDFFYKPFYTYNDGHIIWSTTSTPQPQAKMIFAKAWRVYNVIDVRQSYLQSIINQLLAALEHKAESRNFIHYAYEMVALTPRCVKELGMDLSPEEESKSYVEVSGRKGRAVRADELIGMLVGKSLQEVKLRNPAFPGEKAEALAKKIAVGAVRYFMIKYHLNTVIAFDFKEALNFEGDTGPYLQYTMVRINSILSKLSSPYVPQSPPSPLSSLSPQEAGHYWEIVLNLSLLELQVERSLESLDLSSLSSYANSLGQKLNHYYHLYPIISEENPKVRDLRLRLILVFKKTMEQLLEIMGIPVPEKM